MKEGKESKLNIVIDNGSGCIKAGLGGEESPSAIFPSFIGYPKYENVGLNSHGKEYFVGTDAEQKRGVLELNYPIEHGVVKNWNEMEKIWSYAFFNELKVDPEEHNILITEFSRYIRGNRERIAEEMFETFNVHGLYIANPAVLSLYSESKLNGFVLDLGDGITQFVPIYDGCKLPYNDFNNFGGRDLTQYFVKIFYEYGYRFYNTNEFDVIKNMKEKACYVALDYEEELRSYGAYDYILPDGNKIMLTTQRIRVPEAIFKPSLLNILEENYGNYNNIQQTCYDTIQKCDIDIRKELYNNIVLSGGNSMFNGLPERLTKEIKALVPESMKEEVKVIASPERKYAAWIGGSIISSISTFEGILITKDEYEEYGENIVRRKCFN